MRNSLTIVGILLASACSVGGQYGYSQKVAANLPAPLFDIRQPVRAFLSAKFGQQHPEILLIQDDADNVQVEVTGLRGVVEDKSKEWEKLQLTFEIAGADRRSVSIIADGWSAYGYQPPMKSQYVTEIPENELGTFTGNLRVAFAYYLAHGRLEG